VRGSCWKSSTGSTAEWDAWSDAQEFEASATGLLSREAGPGDSDHIEALRALLGRPGLRHLLGPRLPLAEELLLALERRRQAAASAAENQLP